MSTFLQKVKQARKEKLSVVWQDIWLPILTQCAKDELSFETYGDLAEVLTISTKEKWDELSVIRKNNDKESQVYQEADKQLDEIIEQCDEALKFLESEGIEYYFDGIFGPMIKIVLPDLSLPCPNCD